MTEPRVCLLVIGDGRGLRDATMESWYDHARDYDLATTVEVDDSHHMLGFCGAIRYAWDRLREEPGFEYVFHLEEDWRFDRDFSIAAMTRVLDTEPRIAQVALRRGAEPGEVAPIDDVPELFEDRDGWLEHTLFFTTNPSVYRHELVEAYDWPRVPQSEWAFTERLVEDERSFAYWGTRQDAPWITHTGTRAGHGY